MRLQEIRERNDRRKTLSKERKNEYSMAREIEYQRLVDKSVDDIEYLLNHCDKLKEMILREQYWRVRYETALKKISVPMPGSRDNELVLYYERMAEEALKEDTE